VQLRLSLLHDVLQLLSVLVLLAISIAPGDNTDRESFHGTSPSVALQ
jgi:hypothetical protein